MSNTPLFGEEDMTKGTPIQVCEHEEDLYASHEDFHTIFNEDLKELYQFSLLLTRDPGKAERCLVTGLEDCVSGNRVFREWGGSWRNRKIVQIAVRELRPRPSRSASAPSGAIFSDIVQHLGAAGGGFENHPAFRVFRFVSL